MKKVLFFIVVLVAGLALTSFVINKHSSKDKAMGNEMEYFTSVTAWYEETESHTIYIFFKEGNGVRKYYACSQKNGYDVFYDVSYNECYGKCNDYTRKYKYECRMGYFNANLPKMKK